MAVSDFALITLAQVKTQLGLTDANAARDAWIESEIERISYEMEVGIGRGIVARDYEQDLDGSGTSTLFVPQYPILSIITLIDDTERLFTRSTDLVKKNSRIVDPVSDGVIQVWNEKGTFARSHNNVRIHYHAGYADISVGFTENQLTFSEISGGTRYTVTIPPARYDVVSLGSRLAVEMSASGLNTYQISYDTRRRVYGITLSTGATGTLQLHGATGTSPLLSKMAFGTSADLTGATVYTSSTAVRPRVPLDLEKAAVNAVIFFYDRSGYGAGNRDVKSEQIGDYSISYGASGALPAFIDSTIERYREWGID